MDNSEGSPLKISPSPGGGRIYNMEETLRFTEENGKPELRMKGSLGEVIVVFAEQESESNLKKGLLQMILQSYEDRVLGTNSEKDAS